MFARISSHIAACGGNSREEDIHIPPLITPGLSSEDVTYYPDTASKFNTKSGGSFITLSRSERVPSTKILAEAQPVPGGSNLAQIIAAATARAFKAFQDGMHTQSQLSGERKSPMAMH